MPSQFTKIRVRNRLISLMPGLASFYERQRIASRFLKRWQRDGLTVPLPGLFKRLIIKRIALDFSCDVLVETGTYLGDTPWFFRRFFKRIYSIEVSPGLAELARARFRNWPTITIVEGDSAISLRSIVDSLTGKTLFWLDGHYSAGLTSRGITDCPILEELDVILNKPTLQPVLMIDDARCFGRDKDYPSIDELEKYVKIRNANLTLRVENDILFFLPLIAL